MAFWFQGSIYFAAGETRSVEYWLNGGADMGVQTAAPVPYLSANPQLRATGQGLRYDYSARKFFYWVDLKNAGNESAVFQLRGGGVV